MTDLFKLILGMLASLVQSRAKLEAENLVLRQQINMLRRRAPKRPHLNNTDRFLLVWLYHWFPTVLGDCDCQARDHHSLAPRWVSGILALAITQPCWQTEGLG
jgi:dolichyl-phosphate-mannose--protein O-mannosyl transferase